MYYFRQEAENYRQNLLEILKERKNKKHLKAYCVLKDLKIDQESLMTPSYSSYEKSKWLESDEKRLRREK